MKLQPNTHASRPHRTGCAAILALLALTAGATLPAQAQDGQAILDALVRKGVLTAAEAEQITAEADKKASPLSVVIGGKSTTKLSLGGRLQVQYDALSTDIDDAQDPSRLSHFFIRRAYVSLKADVATNASVQVVYDFASTSFDAAFIQLKPSEDLALHFGLRKVNLGYEEATVSSGSLKAIERSGATRYFVEPANGNRLGAGGYRLGVFAEGKEGPFFWGAALTNPERVTAATSAGNGDNNNIAAWANVGVKGKFGRWEDSRYIFGTGVGYLPDQGGVTPGSGDDLLVANVYTELTFGKFNVIAEVLYSDNENGAGANGDANSYGFWIQPSYRFNKNWEGVFRYSYTDSDGRGINVSDGIRNAPAGGTMDTLTDYYLGFTYYISGDDLKFQAGYVYGESQDTVTGGSAKATSSGIRSQMQVQF